MNDAPRSLDALRREIDTVDDALHDLLMQRAALVGEIGALKSGERTTVFRPAREALLLRRLLARSDGALPTGALVRIWSEIIAASWAWANKVQIAVASRASGDENLTKRS